MRDLRRPRSRSRVLRRPRSRTRVWRQPRSHSRFSRQPRSRSRARRPDLLGNRDRRRWSAECREEGQVRTRKRDVAGSQFWEEGQFRQTGNRRPKWLSRRSRSKSREWILRSRSRGQRRSIRGNRVTPHRSRRWLPAKDRPGIFFGNVIREGARLTRVERDGNTQRNLGEIRSRN